MKYVEAAFLCVGNFLIGFLICATGLMPHLPPYPPRPGSLFDRTMWTTNWAGAVLGVLLVVREIQRIRRVWPKAEVG